MRRVAIHGCSGSGKSTLGRTLAHRLAVPYLELDAFWHEPNWKTADIPVFRERVAEAVSGDAWVVDGNYKQSVDLVYARCDTILMLDFPLPLILWRLNGRIWRRGLFRLELWNGNRESVWRHFFTRESLFLWVFQTYRRRREYAAQIMADPSLAHVERRVFRKPKELRIWLQNVNVPTPSIPMEGGGGGLLGIPSSTER